MAAASVTLTGCNGGIDKEIEALHAKHVAGGSPPVYQACHAGRLDLVDELLDRGASIGASVEPETGEHAIHAAATSGNLKLVEFLVQRGADPDQADAGGGRPLHQAVKAEHPDVAAYLISVGVPLDREDRFGMHPIHVAASTGSVEMIEILRNAGVSLDSKCGLNKRVAGMRGNVDSQVTSLLMRGGINPIDGSQPIHVAARMGKPEVVRYLLAQGVKPDIKDNNGRTPRDYAEQEGPLEGGRQEVAALLEESR